VSERSPSGPASVTQQSPVAGGVQSIGSGGCSGSPGRHPAAKNERGLARRVARPAASASPGATVPQLVARRHPSISGCLALVFGQVWSWTRKGFFKFSLAQVCPTAAGARGVAQGVHQRYDRCPAPAAGRRESRTRSREELWLIYPFDMEEPSRSPPTAPRPDDSRRHRAAVCHGLPGLQPNPPPVDLRGPIAVP
jgi:hypothetical protein